MNKTKVNEAIRTLKKAYRQLIEKVNIEKERSSNMRYDLLDLVLINPKSDEIPNDYDFKEDLHIIVGVDLSEDVENYEVYGIAPLVKRINAYCEVMWIGEKDIMPFSELSKALFID